MWNEYEQATSQVAQLVHQIDKLECIDQAILYEERSGKDMSEFMKLRDVITLPELQDWLQDRLMDYESLKLRNVSNAKFVFISGRNGCCSISHRSLHLSGGPGVGKGTQCELLVQEFGFLHLSVGDVLRSETTNAASPYQAFILESMKESVLIPAQLTTFLIRQRIEKAQAEGYTRFLLDGFPRSVSQAESFRQKVDMEISIKTRSNFCDRFPTTPSQSLWNALKQHFEAVWNSVQSHRKGLTTIRIPLY